MELFLDNVGIIKESAVIIDGLTVITGKNSSGKTTVGKTMYSLLSAGTNLEESFDKAKRSYLISQLIKIERTLRIRRTRNMRTARRSEKKLTMRSECFFPYQCIASECMTASIWLIFYTE